jgi:hypothetical protein
MESATGRQWPKNKAAREEEASASSTDVGHPVFCAQVELDALRCLQTNGKNSPACNDNLEIYRNCIATQKQNIKLGVIDCSTYHSQSMLCLEQYSYDKDACRDQFLNYKMCNGQRQASIKWQRKIGNIK